MIRAEIASGEVLQFPDGTPDADVHAAVLRHIESKQKMSAMERHTAAMERLAKAIDKMAAAYLAPREIKVNRDLSGDNVTGAKSKAEGT